MLYIEFIYFNYVIIYSKRYILFLFQVCTLNLTSFGYEHYLSVINIILFYVLKN